MDKEQLINTLFGDSTATVHFVYKGHVSAVYGAGYVLRLIPNTCMVHKLYFRGTTVQLVGNHTQVEENAEALAVATKEIGLEVNADKTKYMVMSGEQTAGLSHTMKVDDSSIERVEAFKYLGTTLTNQNCIQKEIRSRLKLGNACYRSVWVLT